MYVFVIIIIKIDIIIIMIIITTIIIITGTFFLSYAQNVDSTSRKKMTKLLELEGGRGGAFLIRAMPERKRAFPNDVFPKVLYTSPHPENHPTTFSTTLLKLIKIQ